MFLNARSLDSELDLSDPSDVLAYLADTPFASTRAERLSGGNANFIFRLYLATPFEGKATLVLKHTKPWIAMDKTFKFAVERQDIEAECLKHVKAILPIDALATVPALHHHDSVARVLIMDDCGLRARTLKDLLRDVSAPLSESAALTIGDALGTFLATVHTRGSADHALLDAVRENEEGKNVSAWVTYGQVVETLKGEGKSAGKVDPPLVNAAELSEEDVADIEMLAASTAQAIRDAQATFTMGDFWTGNIVVCLDNDGQRVERIFVIDWEMAKPGLPFLDYAQFTAEMHTLGRFYSHSTERVGGALKAYAAAYRNATQVDEEYVRGAAAHLGVHLVVWTPRAGWEPKEKTREVAKEGAEYLLKSKRGDMDWLKTSVVGDLFIKPDVNN